MIYIFKSCEFNSFIPHIKACMMEACAALMCFPLDGIGLNETHVTFGCDRRMSGRSCAIDQGVEGAPYFMVYCSGRPTAGSDTNESAAVVLSPSA